MVSIDTKDMRLPTISRRFKHTDLVFSIEARLRASANTGPSSLTKKELSILSEWQVVCHRSRHFNEELIAHRERIGGVEIDLLFRGRNASAHWSLIEVKSRSDDLWDYGPAVSNRQKQRYLRVLSLLKERFEAQIDAQIAVVCHNERRYLDPEIRYFELGESLY